MGRDKQSCREARIESDESLARLNGESPVPLPREAQGRIGKHLREIYGNLLSEPLPDKFSKLLDDLARKERSE